MRVKSKIHTVTLTESQAAALSEIATKNQTLSRSGITTGQPSWRALLSAIADGSLVVTSKANAAPGREKKKKDRKPFKAHPKWPAKWWKPDSDESMTIEAAVAASGYPVEELLAGGMVIVADNLSIQPTWVEWMTGGTYE